MPVNLEAMRDTKCSRCSVAATSVSWQNTVTAVFRRTWESRQVAALVLVSQTLVQHQSVAAHIEERRQRYGPANRRRRAVETILPAVPVEGDRDSARTGFPHFASLDRLPRHRPANNTAYFLYTFLLKNLDK